jgi:hypothetical protein
VEYHATIAELTDLKLGEEYSRVKEILFKGYRYGLWDIPEADLFGMIAALETELAKRRVS